MHDHVTRLTLSTIAVFAAVGSASAVPIAGVDFEDGVGGWSRSPDDLDAGDGITVSADWTLQITGKLRNDAGANAAGAFEGNFPARLETGGAFSITIPDTVVLDLTNVSFQVRGATGSTGAPSGRIARFNTSLDGATLPDSLGTPITGTILYDSGSLPGRPTWTAVSIDLTDSLYKGLTDTTIYFHFYGASAVDIDAIVISGDLGGAGLPGDTNGDNDIDDSDLGTSLANYTGPVGDVGKTAAEGDTDGDGDVDDSDLGTSFANYTGPLSPASVPEPTSLAIIGLSGLALIRRRR